MPELADVPEEDQGIDWDQEVQPGVYVLKVMSSGEAITEDGEPVYVDANGGRAHV